MPDHKPELAPAERVIFTQSTAKKDIENKKDSKVNPAEKKPGIFASIWRGLAGS
jgi:hypothetical protein